MRIRAAAPATAANLGPAFDCLALALDLWNEFDLDTEAAPGLEVEGEGSAELADPGAHLVLSTIRAVAERRGADVPPFRLRCTNRVPLARGLGSSASAVVAGILMAERLFDAEGTPEARLAAATEIEGHPDNAAACLAGGLALVHRPPHAEAPEAIRLEPHPALRPVVLVPESERVSTEAARRALPSSVPMSVAVTTLARAALAVVALTQRPDLLGDALVDELHEPFRLPLAPRAAAAHERLRADGFPVCVAGSGPSLLVFEQDPARPVPEPGEGWRVLRPQVASSGAFVGEA
ncbi:MAG TPA: homoserine kinase [Actinomycetota bacterium]|nr:homoserine kinase [Actinomycetota bacterium]